MNEDNTIEISRTGYTELVIYAARLTTALDTILNSAKLNYAKDGLTYSDTVIDIALKTMDAPSWEAKLEKLLKEVKEK